MENFSFNIPKAVLWKNGELFLLDQTLLPNQVVMEKQETIEQVENSIKTLKTRGAPAIGITAAYGLLTGIKEYVSLPAKEFLEIIRQKADYLFASRPTAVNLGWALRRMTDKAESIAGDSATIFKELEKEAIKIQEEEINCCNLIGEHGSVLIKDGIGILTHCNAGGLAVSEMGTALAPFYTAHSRGTKFKVFADETRPLLQGARLTVWELERAGVDVSLICDSMAAHFMSLGEIQLAIVGADRVAANGDAANKIGTLGAAIAASYFKIPFYVACPLSTVDMETSSGEDIEIEERDKMEIIRWGDTLTTPEQADVRNPAFDITPHNLIAGIITEKGIVSPPYHKNLKNCK